MAQARVPTAPRRTPMTRIVIIGGGPAGYEAALVPASLGAQGAELATVGIDLPAVNQRVKGLAVAQSADIKARLIGEGVRVVAGQGRLSDEVRGLGGHRVEVLG